MSYKSSKLPPQGAHGTQMQIFIRGPWSIQSADFQDMRFLRSWLVYDSERDEDGFQGHVNRNALLGFALAMGISASFWTGIGLAVAHGL